MTVEFGLFHHLSEILTKLPLGIRAAQMIGEFREISRLVDDRFIE